MRRRLVTWVALLVVGLAGVVAVSAAAGLAARSAASQFELVVEGHHVPMCDDPACDGAVRHVGRFTASGAFCSSGDMTEVFDWEYTPLVFTCADGSGTATAAASLPGPDVLQGVGGWSIVSGTGAYAKLRGLGRFTSTGSGGDPFDYGSTTFRSRWTGVADLDDVAPTIEVSAAAATKLRRPRNAYSLRLTLALRDDVAENPVAYDVTVTDGRFDFAAREGSTAAGVVSMTLPVRLPSARFWRFRIEVTATDPLGNESSLTHVVRLPG